MTGEPGQAVAERVEDRLGPVLRAGVWISTALLAAGLLAWILLGPASAVAAGLLHGGLIALMATPVLRVIVAIVAYVRAGDWSFVATGVAVLAILTGTLIAALAV